MSAIIAPKITVILAIHEPDVPRLAKQLESLSAQEDVTLDVIAVLDGVGRAEPRVADALRRHGVQIVHTAERLGARGAFAHGLSRGLAASPDEDRLFAYCDQDDVWHPRKLAQTAAALHRAGAALAHCDARVIGSDGTLIAGSLHAFERREEPADLLDAIILNSVTGMTAVFTRPVAHLSVKLMEGLPSTVLHDHITAVAAMALGPIAVVNKPLVDYVQHESNALGAVVPPLPHWWQRSFVLKDIRAYRRTSAEVFGDRREIARALAREKIAPGALAEMFVLRPVSRLRVLALYTAAFWRRLLSGRPRRAAWCWRFGDAALAAVRRSDF